MAFFDYIRYMNGVQQHTKSFTYADYLTNWVDERVELIKGQLFKMSPPPSSEHQEISGELYGNIWLNLKEKSCKVYSAPFDVVLPIPHKSGLKANTVVQPDLTIICDPTIIKERGCFGVPDMVVEILSKGTSKKDLQDKFDLYEEVGIKEYWIVYPGDELVEVFYLESGKYQRSHAYTSEDVLTSVLLPDLKIDLNLVFPKSKGDSNQEEAE